FAHALPQSPAYTDYATNHWRELIERVEPCALWNDINFPASLADLDTLFAHYYARVSDGVVNDRFKMAVTDAGIRPVAHHDFTTSEYENVNEIRAKKWEAVRGLGHSFGYNQQEGVAELLSAHDLITTLVDVVSKNGNLLLNIGPRADGSIPELQSERLLALKA